MDKDRVKDFALRNALLMDFVQYDGVRFDTPEIRKKIMSWEGQYGYNGGVVAFVVDGHYYATPLVDEAIKVLEESGFENAGIYCPFNAHFSFPGRLSSEQLKDLWKSAYYPQSRTLAAAEKEIKYYQMLMKQNSAYRRWNYLLEKSGDDSMDYAVKLIIEDLFEKKDEYNAKIAKELGIENEVDLQGSRSNSQRR